jgi:hypothetical protein
MIQTIFGSTVVFLKTDNVESLFPTSLYEETVNYLLDPNNNFIDHPQARNGKIYTTAQTLNPEKWEDIIRSAPLLDFLKTNALNYAHLYSSNPIQDIKFHASWCNLIYRGCEISCHRDNICSPKKSLIVLFYVKIPNNSSNLVFVRNGKDGDWPTDRPDEDLVCLRVTEGDIIMIDNFIWHAVDPHNSDSPRMCIAVEFKIET